MTYYTLDENKNPVPAELMQWAKYFETSERVLQKDEIGNVTISTVFLGIDHSFSSGPPLLWETMIFGGEHDEYQDRYSTYEQAKEGHEKAKRMVLQSQGNPTEKQIGKSNSRKPL